MRRTSRVLFVGLGLALGTSVALAQSDQAPATSTNAATSKPPAKKTKPARHKFDPYQSPLATIMQSHLHPDVPEAEDFVRESRPAKKDLKFTPLQSQMGPDPVRPKPRDAANIMALQAEMEASLSHNAARAGHGKARRPKDSASN